MATLSTSTTMSGLKPGAVHRFKVQARNSMGYGQMSTASAAITTTTGVPDAPSMPAIVGNTTASTVTVSWSPPNTNGAAISKYAVQYQKQGDGAWTSSSTAVMTTQHMVTGLSPNKAHNVRVQAH